jgi:hypothetical protein
MTLLSLNLLWKVASNVIVATIVDRNELSRSILSETDNLIVSNIKHSMLIRSSSVKDNITRSGLSKTDRSTVASHSASVTSFPVLSIDEIVAISKSRPVQPGHKGAAISYRGNSLIRAGFLSDTVPSASALRIADIFAAAGSPHSSTDDSLTSSRNFAWRTIRCIRLRLWLRWLIIWLGTRLRTRARLGARARLRTRTGLGTKINVWAWLRTRARARARLRTRTRLGAWLRARINIWARLRSRLIFIFRRLMIGAIRTRLWLVIIRSRMRVRMRMARWLFAKRKLGRVIWVMRRVVGRMVRRVIIGIFLRIEPATRVMIGIRIRS